MSEVPLLITGDFNAKSPEWGSPVEDQRGRLLAEFIAPMDMTVANTGVEPSFVRGASRSWIDVTMARRIHVKDWMVRDKESLSLHRYIVFDVLMERRSRAPGRVVHTGWATQKLNPDVFRRTFKAMLNATTEEGRLEYEAPVMHDCLAAACDASMPRRATRPSRPPVHGGATNCRY